MEPQRSQLQLGRKGAGWGCDKNPAEELEMERPDAFSSGQDRLVMQAMQRGRVGGGEGEK